MNNFFKYSYFRVLTFKLVFLTRYRENGISWLFKGLLKHVVIEASWVMLLPISVIGHVCGYRKLNVRVEHIGHLALEPDTLLKEVGLGILKRKRWFLLAPSSEVSNLHLLNYWKPYFPVITDSIACQVLNLMSRHYFLKTDVSRYIARFFGSQDVYRINRLWGQTPPILQLTSEDEEWGAKKLIELGIPDGAWFVGVHVREGGYLPQNELIQSHRNASILNAMTAIKEIVRRGGFCVRMGDPSMVKLPKMEGVVDYAHHPLKSDRLDLVLCAKARFLLGCTSGLAFVSSIFGVPVAHANMIPIETLGIRYCDLSIPKLLWSESLEQYLTFREIFSSEISGCFFTHQYQKAKIRVDENSPEDILKLVVEMMDRLEGVFLPNKEDEQLHKKYMDMFKPGHYSYGTASKIGISFLRRHQHLIG
jgi:putative glycosyltransferase (TIGR04372 family)